MLVPLALGLLVNNRYAAVAARLQPTLALIGIVALMLGIVALLVLNWRMLLTTFAIFAVLLLILGVFLIGWFLAGPDPTARPVFGLGTVARNIRQRWLLRIPISATPTCSSCAWSAPC